MDAYAQKAKQRRQGLMKADSTQVFSDSLAVDSLIRLDDLRKMEALQAPVDTAALIRQNDSIQQAQNLPVIPKERFIPDSRKSVWLALVFPGGGQIYNRKYWKLPIVYGGFVGCAYALTWNNRMYKDYSQAYLDIMDDDENTKSYEEFLPPGYDISSRMDYYKELFRKRKDIYRRYRDLSIFCFIGVYVLSVIDAYCDAELSDFDISKDLGLKINPVMFNDSHTAVPNAVGLQCSFTF